MAAGSKRAVSALPGRYVPDASLRFEKARPNGRARPSSRQILSDVRFLGLVAGLSLAAFAIVFAWNWLPWPSAPSERPSPHMQQLMAMNERQMQRVVWPDTPGALEAQQPELSGMATRGSGIRVSVEFAPCVGAHRVTCVVDGDTIWYQGTKIRIADINAPEVSEPQCDYEAQLGAQATARFTELLNQGPFTLWPIGRDYDKYGRRLLIAKRGGKSLGGELVAEGLAEHWRGHPRNWCTG